MVFKNTGCCIFTLLVQDTIRTFASDCLYFHSHHTWECSVDAGVAEIGWLAWLVWLLGFGDSIREDIVLRKTETDHTSNTRENPSW